MRRQFILGVPILLAFLVLSNIFNYSLVIAETAVSAPITKQKAAVVVNYNSETQYNSVMSDKLDMVAVSHFIPPYDMPLAERSHDEKVSFWRLNQPPRKSERLEDPVFSFHENQSIPIHQPDRSQLDLGWREVLAETADVQKTEPEMAPLALTADGDVTLTPLHRNSQGTGLSSSFVYTNVGSGLATYAISFYWPNGEVLYNDILPSLGDGQSAVYNLNNAGFGENNFFGYAMISSDQPVEATITTPDYGVVYGTIYEDDGITPFSADHIYINEWPSNNWHGGVYVLSDGSYYLGGLNDTDYTLGISPGYPWARQWYNGHTQYQDADVFPVSGGVSVTVDFVLQPGGLITGTVFASDGVTPLENINVDLASGDYGVCTDENGRFVLEGVPYGDHKVQAGGDWNWCIDQSSPFMTEYYSETNDVDQAALITVNSTTDIVTGLTFTMEEGGKIIGQVTEKQTGQPIPSISISASEYDNENYWRSATTDANGIYTITGLIDNDYRVRMDDWDAMLNGWAQQYYDREFAHHMAGRVSVSGLNTVTNIDFALEPGGIITGVVTDQNSGLPLANINMEAELESHEGGVGGCTQENGTFILAGMIHGEYEVSASNNNWNYCLNQPRVYATEFYDDVPQRDLAILVTVGSKPCYRYRFFFRTWGHY